MVNEMEPEQIVTKFIDYINEMNLEQAVSLLSENCEYDNVPMGKVFGRDAIHQQLMPMMDRCEQIEWITRKQTSTGKTVMNERLDKFLWPHGWVEMPCAGIFEIDNGEIALWRDYFDLPTYINQLPTPSE
ncbi:MAG: limonene-1,2-epoxide hydrolase family protein [Acidimicrobiales bacterium]|jgi:limonene-1,2-epoxide hydrolase|nr:limonene-1,2-epoxide hydrolase family protein [Acidimicrobiales bacterium]HJM96673.1 limonene-1,2-epoxide hydrolase family protein [Acidimicrobiales bacterium]